MIKVGIIGASPERGWALRAHVPALRSLPQYEITAVGTTRRESAEQAARAFGAAHAFTDARQLAEHPDVDLVAITVKVPQHAELVHAALAAGKHVYCEWPLALTTAEAAELTAAASGVHHAVGLQARHSPVLTHARQLIADGFIGEVLSANIYAARGKGATEEVPAWTAYTYEQASGAGLVEVYGGHVLDAAQYLLGDIADVAAMLAIRRTRHTVAETGEPLHVTAPDQLLLTAAFGGAPAAIHLHDGRAAGSEVRIEISATAGDLLIDAAPTTEPLGLQLQISPLRLHGPQGPIPVRTPFGELVAEARNVAALYSQLAEDIRTGTTTVPTFHDGLRLHELLDEVRQSAARRSPTRTPAPPVAAQASR
jgi:predicted dehydrogenase